MLSIADIKRFRLKPLKCPHCGKKLESHRAILMAIATRNCTGCGRQIAAPPEADHDPPPFARGQLDVAEAASAKVRKRVGWIAASGMISYVALMVGLVLYDVILSAESDPYVKRGWPVILAMCAIAAVALIPVVWISIRSDRSILKCPSCSASIACLPWLIRSTGNCGKCGRHLIALPPQSSDKPLLTIAEIQAAQARIGGSDRHELFLGLLIVGMIAVLHLPLGIFALANRGAPWEVLEEQYGLKASVGIVFSVLVAWSVLIGWRLIKLMRISDRRFELRYDAEPVLKCVHCQKTLGFAAIASRRCSSCHEVVLAEP